MNFIDIKIGKYRALKATNVNFTILFFKNRDINAEEVNFSSVTPDFNTIKKEIEAEIGKVILCPEQTHSTNICFVSQEFVKQNLKDQKLNNTEILPLQNCDALITNSAQIALTSFSADCIITAVYCPDIKYCAIIHSGWKGSLNEITEKTLQKLINFGANLNLATAYVSPSIFMESYPVQGSFLNDFIQKDTDNYRYFFHKNDRNTFDPVLPQYVYQGNLHYDNRLKIADAFKKFNLTNVKWCNINTFADTDFASYRRSIEKNNKLRFLSLIYLHI